MNKIWEFFENMNKFLYVSDMDTYEIVYMNKKSLDAFGISSIDEIKNKKCHEILQNPNPDKTIDIILEYLGTALHAERTYIFEQRPNLHNDNTYEWVAKGITPEKDNLQDVLAEACENWYTAFKQCSCTVRKQATENKR